MLKTMLSDLDAEGHIQNNVEEEEEMFRWVTATLFTGEHLNIAMASTDDLWPQKAGADTVWFYSFVLHYAFTYLLWTK